MTQIDTSVTNPLILAVQQAEAAVLAATTPEQYREAELVLINAGLAMKEKVQERHAWLERNWLRLKELELTLSPDEYNAKEAIWMAKCAEYEEWFRVLAHALTIVALPSPGVPEELVKAEAPAMTPTWRMPGFAITGRGPSNWRAGPTAGQKGSSLGMTERMTSRRR